ncbi:MAG: hypothetical protein U0793_03600 [Gemmataceae bacterium]
MTLRLALTVLFALTLRLAPAHAQDEDPCRNANAELSKIKGLSGLGSATATGVVHEITFGRPGQDN